MFKQKNLMKRIAGISIAATLGISAIPAFALGTGNDGIEWKVKDYITTTGFSGTAGNTLGTGHGGSLLAPAYEIVYEQYLNDVATGYIISGNEAEHYGLKGFATDITRPVTWNDSAYPNWQYEEIWADGMYTGLTWPTGARPNDATDYNDVRFGWEVGGTHKELAIKKWITGYNGNGAPIYNDANLNTYPIAYTGSNAAVEENNAYFGFDVFQVDTENSRARDVEVVLDKTGNAVNTSNYAKTLMINAANTNTVTGSITPLVNSGSGVDSVLYDMLTPATYAGKSWGNDDLGIYHEVPMFDFTGYSSDFFDNKIYRNHSLNLTGPTYDYYGGIENPTGLSIDAYRDCVQSNLPVIGDTGSWTYDVNATRFGFYTNNLVTTYPASSTFASSLSIPALSLTERFNENQMAECKWVYGGYEIEEPYRIYEYLSIDGIVFDGNIDNDSALDTPVIFRYPTRSTANILPVGSTETTTPTFAGEGVPYALADPKVEWRYDFVQASYPHEIYMRKYVEGVATGKRKGTQKYAKENMVAEVNPASDTATVPSAHKHYQMRLEWVSNDGILYVTPYFNIDEHAGEFMELTPSTATTDYLGAYDAPTE